MSTPSISALSATRPSAIAASDAPLSSAEASAFGRELKSSLAAGSGAAGPKASQYNHGRFGVELNERGEPRSMVYFDEAGKRLTGSAFNASEILRHAEMFGLPLDDLKGLGEKLDAAGVGYRPYELYAGSGSDHGVDFGDLMGGGLGSAYDWRKDEFVADKGDLAQQQLLLNQQLASRLGLNLNQNVTTEQGIDPSRFKPVVVGSGDKAVSLDYVAFNGKVAAWYGSQAEATTAAAQYRGQVVAANGGRAVAQAKEEPPATAQAPIQAKPASMQPPEPRSAAAPASDRVETKTEAPAAALGVLRFLPVQASLDWLDRSAER